ncbi:hypothetical protein BR93DRAFT_402415 [Coniochaeta sp. PMI_546]|nr:hypothetical protein BR93DRAFT_402415 [Coniochaeta sp. PMI_546]
MATASVIPADDDIDHLLERYLGLIEEYSKLRSTLTTLQINVYQGIARANFTAERGIRYGQELYDERMQASRSLAVTPGEDGTAKFEVIYHGDELGDSQGDEKKEVTEAEKEDESQADDEKDKVRKPSDPLKWFGILTPISLRLAQGKAIQAVQQVIPKLATVDAEMAEVEIRVRRARKKRSKAEAAAMKQQQQALDSGKATMEDEAAVDSDKGTEILDEKQSSLSMEKEARSKDEALASRLESASLL